MESRMDDQITGAISENESLREQVAALEANVAMLQALSDEYAERVTKEIESVKLLRAALVELNTEVDKRVADPVFELRYAMAEARAALEATK